MFIGYFLMGYLLASLKIEKMTDILRMRRFQTLMTSVRVKIRQNLWQVRFILLRMLWSANLKARGFLLYFIKNYCSYIYPTVNKINQSINQLKKATYDAIGYRGNY